MLRDGCDGDLERRQGPHSQRRLARAPRVDRLLKRRQPLPLRVFIGGDQSVRRLKRSLDDQSCVYSSKPGIVNCNFFCLF